ncbi:MAG: DNA polymerase IV [Actinomycetota bacterium]|nr:DNA polymerase IV [Actinomycetota bacterium]
MFVRSQWHSPTAHILHADLDSFFASVEQRDQPGLRGLPVIVGGGVVLAASDEAKAFGIRSAMGIREARRRCPAAVVVSPRMGAYTDASKAVFGVFRDTTPLVEPISIDEAFLDVGGLGRVSGEPVEIAARLRQCVRDQVGLAITVGVARTKFLAKVASAIGKPDGLLVVLPDREREFLHPLPVERLWGVGQVTAAKLRERGILTVGDLAEVEQRSLNAMLGAATGHHLAALANLRDPRPVRVGRRRSSIGAQRALGHHWLPAPEIDAMLCGLVDRVSRRLRAAGRRCRTVVLRLRFGDFARATRSHTLARPTDQTETLLACLRLLMDGVRPLTNERSLTLIGVSLSNLDDESPQLELPFELGPGPGLDAALDTVRDRFGAGAIGRAALLRRGTGLEMPILPD